MSLKITDLTGFKIGGVANPSITEIYVRPLPDMAKQSLLSETEIEIQTTVKTTIEGGLFDSDIKVDFIYSLYQTKYSTTVTDMNAQYLEIEEDLKAQIIESNPQWNNSIEIVNIETT